MRIRVDETLLARAGGGRLAAWPGLRFVTGRRRAAGKVDRVRAAGGAARDRRARHRRAALRVVARPLRSAASPGEPRLVIGTRCARVAARAGSRRVPRVPRRGHDRGAGPARRRPGQAGADRRHAAPRGRRVRQRGRRWRGPFRPTRSCAWPCRPSSGAYLDSDEDRRRFLRLVAAVGSVEAPVSRFLALDRALADRMVADARAAGVPVVERRRRRRPKRRLARSPRTWGWADGRAQG